MAAAAAPVPLARWLPPESAGVPGSRAPNAPPGARPALRRLTRPARSVAPTDAGERLARTLAPRLEEIDAELTELTELREKPAGTIRITADEHAAGMVLWPALEKFLPDYPDIKVEIVIDFGQIGRAHV